MIDLHTHSTASDGTMSPSKLVQYASSKGISVLALTDHDTTQGLAEAGQEAEKLGITFVPGIEIPNLSKYNYTPRRGKNQGLVTFSGGFSRLTSLRMLSMNCNAYL